MAADGAKHSIFFEFALTASDTSEQALTSDRILRRRVAPQCCRSIGTIDRGGSMRRASLLIIFKPLSFAGIHSPVSIAYEAKYARSRPEYSGAKRAIERHTSSRSRHRARRAGIRHVIASAPAIRFLPLEIFPSDCQKRAKKQPRLTTKRSRLLTFQQPAGAPLRPLRSLR